MRLLLDTHVFLWYITAHPELPTKFKEAIQDSANDVYLSAASIWEAVIKHAIGKLSLPEPPATYLPRQREAHQISPLPIGEQAFIQLAGLPPIHRDPFDRLLIAQSLHHGFILASTDAVVRAYPVPLLPMK